MPRAGSRQVAEHVADLVPLGAVDVVQLTRLHRIPEQVQELTRPVAELFLVVLAVAARQL